MKTKMFVLMLLLLSMSVFAEPVYLQQNEIIKLGNHIIEVIDVNKDETKCGIFIDDKVHWLSEGDVLRHNNVYVKLFDAIAISSSSQDRDVCEVLVTLIDDEIVKNSHDLLINKVGNEEEISSDVELNDDKEKETKVTFISKNEENIITKPTEENTNSDSKIIVETSQVEINNEDKNNIKKEKEITIQSDQSLIRKFLNFFSNLV